MKQQNINSNNKIPIMRMRHLAVIAFFVGIMAAGPLCIVWKQVYITQLSIRQKAVSDSVAVLSKQSAQLRLSIDRLSETGRIENIARGRLGLEYPQAGKIVIIRADVSSVKKTSGGGGFFAILRRSITGERG
jgi:cell division protein FtsL